MIIIPPTVKNADLCVCPPDVATGVQVPRPPSAAPVGVAEVAPLPASFTEELACAQEVSYRSEEMSQGVRDGEPRQLVYAVQVEEGLLALQRVNAHARTRAHTRAHARMPARASSSEGREGDVVTRTMHMNMHVATRTHACMLARTHAGTHAHVHACSDTLTCMHALTHPSNSCMHICTHARTRARILTVMYIIILHCLLLLIYRGIGALTHSVI